MTRRLILPAVLLAMVSFAAAAEKGRKPKRGNGPAPAKHPMDSATERVYKTIGSVKLHLFIFSPPNLRAGENRAAIIFFHGGGGTPAAFARQCGYLASRGMVAITAGRRDRGSTLDRMRDGRSAVRWVRAHAAALSIDPSRVACAGGSQGGGIALATALSKTIDNEGDDLSISPVPGALVLFNPGLGVSAASGESDRSDLRPEDLPFLAAANHQQNLSRDTPPMIIFHGTEDKVVPFADVSQFVQRAQSVGVRCQLVAYKGRGHSFFDEGPAFQDTLNKADLFLTALGYLPPR